MSEWHHIFQTLFLVALADCQRFSNFKHDNTKPYLVFDSADVIGQYHTLGDDAYDISADSALVLCDGTPYYRKVEYQNCE